MSYTYKQTKTHPDLDAVIVCSDEDTAKMIPGHAAPARRCMTMRRIGLVAGALCLGLAALLAVCAVPGTGRVAHSRSSAAGLRSATNLEGVTTATLKVLGMMAEAIQSADEMSQKVRHSYKDVTQLIKYMNNSTHKLEELGGEVIDELGKPARLSNELEQKLRSLNETEKQKIQAQLLKQLNITSVHDLLPSDYGSTCYGDEEEYDGLCYKRCSLLTKGTHPRRISAFECCAQQPNCLKDATVKARICGGYGISGDSTGNVCPHTPGECLKDEELHEGMCYIRCSLLTSGILQYRDGAYTCCKSKSPLAMLDLGACDTDAKYSMGGGNGGAASPNEPHSPLIS